MQHTDSIGNILAIDKDGGELGLDFSCKSVFSANHLPRHKPTIIHIANIQPRYATFDAMRFNTVESLFGSEK